MDHKRGYPYDYMEDQAVSSPTKRLKDLSHHRDYPQVCRNAGSESNVSSCRENSHLGERYNAELQRSQYKTHIQYGCPQENHGHGPQQQQQQQQQAAACHLPDGAAAAKANAVPPQSVRSGTTTPSASSLEMKMEEVAYRSMLPLVKKELENWAFGSNLRAPKRMPPPDAKSGDEPDDEITCPVCRNPRKFKGWEALLIHAQKYSKQMPWQHRGYFRALQEALFDKKVKNLEQVVAAANTAAAIATAPAAATASPLSTTPCAVDITHQLDAQRLQQQAEQRNGLHWRPDILIVEKEELQEVGHILKQGEGGQRGAQNPKLREVLAVYTHGEGEDEQRHVFVFPASKVGYVGEAEIVRRKVNKKESKLSCIPEESTEGDDEIEKSDEDRGAKSSEMVFSPAITNDAATRCKSLKEALGLQLTLNDPDDIPGKKLFDLEQIHRTSCVVGRWAKIFKSSTQRFEMQRVFRDSPQLAAIDEGFRADLKRIKKYSPACKRRIKEHMAQIEGQFREDHLMWLQQVEEVREQFQELADEAQHKEFTPIMQCMWISLQHRRFFTKVPRACDMFLKMRAELEVTKEMWKQEKEVQHKALRAAQEKAILVVRRRKANQRQERAQMMQLWMEDARLFKQESNRAREERRRLQEIHDKVHDRAEIARKDCPVCLESFRVATQDAVS